MRYCVDANVFITAWNINYPPDVLPKVYTKIEQASDNIIIIKPIFEEIDPISDKKEDAKLRENNPLFDGSASFSDIVDEGKLRRTNPLRMWLIKDAQIEPTPIDDDVKGKALQLEEKYETDETDRGADKNDIKLIAYALINQYTVVTLEGVQGQRPKEKYKYKIPLICQDEGVACIDFVELLRKLNIKI